MNRCGNELVDLATRRLETPLGTMLAAADDGGVRVLQFVDESVVWPPVGSVATRGRDHPHLARLAEELAEYFEGSRRTFSVPVAADGTAFQRRAWEYLQTIPFGLTRSYAQQARGLGDAKAVRAVGQANGANPVAIVIPCHRVIGATGALTGFAAGIERKRWLLAHERTVLDDSLFASHGTPAGSLATL